MRTSVDHTKRVYLNIVGGKFAEQVKSDTPGAIERKNKKEKIVYEILNDRTSGYIKEMKVEKTDYGKALIILMDDVDELYNISIPVDSKFFDTFCAKIGNADLHQMVDLRPYSFENKEGKKIMGMNIYQNDKKLDYFFSKEDPKGKPFPEGDRLDEEDFKVYKIQERKFYCEYISSLKYSPISDETIRDNHSKEKAKSEKENEIASKELEESGGLYGSEADDDLPF